MSVKTGDVFGAGTDADVHLKVFGEKGDTGEVQLVSSDNTSNKFERARTDNFRLELSDIGKVRTSATCNVTINVTQCGSTSHVTACISGFLLNSPDVFFLQINHIRIGHNGSKPGSGWFLDEVRIDVPSQGVRYIFACHRWLDTKEGDGKIEIEMTPTTVEKGNASASPVCDIHSTYSNISSLP